MVKREFEGYLPAVEVDMLRDKCGVFAIYDPYSNTDLRQVAFIGLQGIQHRGQEGAGIAVVSPSQPGIHIVRGRGLAKQVFGSNGEELEVLPQDATAAIGHTWYSIGSSEAIQPIQQDLFALAHNGQFTNIAELQDEYSGFAIEHYQSDSDFVSKLLQEVAVNFYDGNVELAAEEVLPKLEGAFSLCILTPDKLIAARDGIRPLQLGRVISGGYVVTSEYKSIQMLPHVAWDREIEPGEVVIIDEFGERNGPRVSANGVCAFEYFYLSNKHNIIGDLSVEQARIQFGEQFAHYQNLPNVDVVVPIPNSAIPASEGLATALDRPVVRALRRNPNYAKGELEMPRSFLQPTDKGRIAVANEKLVIDSELVAFITDRSVALVDDSVVRGHTVKSNVEKLRQAGAKEVHAFITAPPYKQTCKYGVDVGMLEELLAVRCGGDTRKMAALLGLDSIHFLTIDNVVAVVGEDCCTRCLGGEEPAGMLRKKRQLGRKALNMSVTV